MTSQCLKVARVHIHLTGKELIPENSRFLLISNHRSKFDPITTWVALPNYELAFISKPENFNVPWFGRVIHKCCFMPIDRENPRLALPTIEKSIRLIKENQVPVAVYPEGTRSPDLEIHEFHGAVLKIAQRANVPIVAMTVYGTENVHKNFPFKPTHVYLDIIKVYPAEEISKMKTFEIADKATQDMKANLKKYSETSL